MLVDSSVHTVIDLLAARSKVEGMNVRRLDVFFYGLFIEGQRGTGQIREKVKKDENRIGIVDARSLNSTPWRNRKSGLK